MFRGLNEKKCSNARAYVIRKYRVKTYEKQKVPPEHPRIATLLISKHFFQKKWNPALRQDFAVKP